MHENPGRTVFYNLIRIGLIAIVVAVVVSCAPAPTPTEAPKAAAPAAPTTAPAAQKPAEAPKAAAPTEAPKTAAPTQAPAPKQEAPKATEAPKTAAPAGARKTITVGMHQELEFLNVLYTQGGNSLSASKLAQRGLLFLDKDSNWVGELASEAPSVKNGGVTPDGSKVTYKLKKGITWHDGKPVTSADVKATWDMIMNPSNAVITRFGYNQIQSVDTPDESTVVLNFKTPFAAWATLFDAIIPKHIIDANAAGLDKSPAMRQPVGFGPYKIVQWKTGEFIEYEAFDKYWAGKPKIDRFFIKTYPSVDALLQAVEAKEVDIAWAVPTAFVPKITALERSGIRLVTTPSANDERYVMNADAKLAPIFADKQLRKALQHAVDKKSIVDKLLFGTTTAGVSEWSGSPWEHKSLSAYEYDANKAKQMLDSLGWRAGADGVRVKDGKRLSFKHFTTVGNLQRENVQLLVQQMFKDIGVDMVIENKRTAELFGTFDQNGVWAHGTYEMGGWSHGLRVPDPEVSARYLCSEIATATNKAGAQWYHYCNPEVDKLMLEQAKEFDADKRKALILRAQEILNDEGYWIWLYRVPLHYSVRAEVKNFVLHPFANFYWNPHEWEL